MRNSNDENTHTYRHTKLNRMYKLTISCLWNIITKANVMGVQFTHSLHNYRCRHIYTDSQLLENQLYKFFLSCAFFCFFLSFRVYLLLLFFSPYLCIRHSVRRCFFFVAVAFCYADSNTIIAHSINTEASRGKKEFQINAVSIIVCPRTITNCVCFVAHEIEFTKQNQITQFNRGSNHTAPIYLNRKS